VWVIGYDHVTDLQVAKGQKIKVGDVIGKAAVQNNGVYRYEIQINKEVNGVTTYYCPTYLLAPDVQASTVTAMEQMITDWNTFMGQNVYGQYTTTCTKPYMTTAEVGS
jgi:murein DD-endopeptidase MepM/ murein hydrolase activator NlpD